MISPRSCFLCLLCFFAATALFGGETAEKQTIEFPSKDKLVITADVWFDGHKDAPFLLLCHQAGWSRGEYKDTAPMFHEMGYNCMAMDQRSGGGVNETENMTASRAEKEGKPTGYLDAQQDIEAAVAHARSQYASGKLVIVGSSYSASLALVIAADPANKVDGVISFSPGEYFGRFGGSPTLVTDAAKKLTIPVFITSARSEEFQWKPIYESIPSMTKACHVPELEGNHGARSLWNDMQGHEGYRKAVKEFLKKNFPTEKPPAVKKEGAPKTAAKEVPGGTPLRE